ncbi:peptidase inhibitor family I36 protein [Amycolatopsis anabasis]|uniref:peptidase inhibitor family I36 protein n=1 Tax=Amycolatopsis anabasis TaxID=1840409 RepID=UPI00131E9BF1|nr:peptidase inhibitor family I36 protein [Amycolatopsis anabasis]
MKHALRRTATALAAGAASLAVTTSTATAAVPHTSAAPAVAPYVNIVASATMGSCVEFRVCFWTGDNYSGYLYRFGGDYAPCEGWRFEGTRLQDHTYSFWNRASGRVSVWDRYADGSYRYHKLGSFPRGFQDGYRFSYRTDAWVYDPNDNCASLNLHVVSAA